MDNLNKECHSYERDKYLQMGYDFIWYYQHIQSGDVKYSVFDPLDLHWSEREMYFTKEVKLEDVPHWGILQLEI